MFLWLLLWSCAVWKLDSWKLSYKHWLYKEESLIQVAAGVLTFVTVTDNVLSGDVHVAVLSLAGCLNRHQSASALLMCLWCRCDPVTAESCGFICEKWAVTQTSLCGSTCWPVSLLQMFSAWILGVYSPNTSFTAVLSSPSSRWSLQPPPRLLLLSTSSLPSPTATSRLHVSRSWFAHAQ